MEAAEILRGVEGISFVYFDERDVVRHSLVQRIVRAYEKYNESIAGRQLSLKLADSPEPPAPSIEYTSEPAGAAGGRRSGSGLSGNAMKSDPLITFRRPPATLDLSRH